jgi:hypothetical protein
MLQEQRLSSASQRPMMPGVSSGECSARPVLHFGGTSNYRRSIQALWKLPAKIVTVASGEMLSGVNFSIKGVSDRGVVTINAALRIPFQFHSDAGVRIPIFSERGKVRLRLTHIPDGNSTEIFLDAPAVTLPIAAGEYQVGIENLPET